MRSGLHAPHHRSALCATLNSAPCARTPSEPGRWRGCWRVISDRALHPRNNASAGVGTDDGARQKFRITLYCQWWVRKGVFGALITLPPIRSRQRSKNNNGPVVLSCNNTVAPRHMLHVVLCNNRVVRLSTIHSRLHGCLRARTRPCDIECRCDSRNRGTPQCTSSARGTSAHGVSRSLGRTLRTRRQRRGALPVPTGPTEGQEVQPA